MNQKGFVNIILILVIVAVVGIAGYFALVKKPAPITKDSTPSSTQDTLSPDKTAQWKTFINTEYSYRISYPPDWDTIAYHHLEYPPDWDIGNTPGELPPEVQRVFIKVIEQDGEYFGQAAVHIYAEPNLLRTIPTEEWYRERVKQIPAGINLEGVKIEETTFKNMKALKIDNSTIYFAKGSTLFRIFWYVSGDLDKSFVTFTEQIFEKMLANFNFFD